MENDDRLTIDRLAPLIQRKKISPVELTESLLNRIRRLQPTINAYITITADLAMAQARKAEKEILRGHYRGVLHGIPISLKDLFHTNGIRTTAGSKILKNYRPKRNAGVVDRLIESGCILLGKTNLHEFAFGATNVNPHYGPVHNPWDTQRISGGSSGGSAASVVSAQALGSIGTDTGGSIRIPSAACGCVGLKPTYGRVSMSGVFPLATSLDHAGPLSRCVMDAAFLFNAIAGLPLCTGDIKRAKTEVGRGIKDWRIGIPRQYFFDQLEPAVRSSVQDAMSVFAQLGAEIFEVDLKGMKETARLAAEITGDEAFAFHEEWLKRRPQDYGEDVLSRLQQCKNTKAAIYIRAQQERLTYGENLARAMETCHMLLTPTLPIVAPLIKQSEIRIGRTLVDVRLALLSLTRPGNLSGLPAISVPCGFSAEGLPVGLQLIGRHSGEAKLLRAAYAYEQATPWHRRFPDDVATQGPLKNRGENE